MDVFLHIWLHIMCMPSAVRGQKRTSDPLGLESQMILSGHMGIGIEPGPLK